MAGCNMKRQHGYFDPQKTKKSMWDYSSKWVLNSPQLAAGKKKAKKAKLGNSALRKKMIEVLASRTLPPEHCVPGPRG